MRRQLLSSLAARLLMAALVISPSCVAKLGVKMTRMSTVYLPTFSPDGSASRYPMPSATVEQLAFEPRGRIVYGVGDGVIHIINARDVMNLQAVDHVMMPGRELTDIEACGGAVFVSYRNSTHKIQGGLLVLKAYDFDTKGLDVLHDIPMSSLPDMVYPTPECTIVVAIENEGFVEDGQFYDPPGSVGIIRFPHGIDEIPEVKILDFTKFNSQFDELSKSGVRWVYRGYGEKFSDNIEPEYVSYNSDYTKAYICLQENNAIAVVDLTTDTIEGIYGLGFKKWGQLDASDKDGGINIHTWPIYGMYQPDSIDHVRWNGEDYIITANEGDAMEYGAPVNFKEDIRGHSINLTDLAPSVSEELRLALKDDSKLGRMKFSNVDGRNADGKIEKLYTYGARSFSVWRASDMALVFDSGSDMEKMTAKLRPDIFNGGYAGETPSKDLDSRSDNKGPETESIDAGQLAGHLVIFAGNERPGTIAVYSVSPGGMKPEFETLFSKNIPHHNQSTTWKQLLDRRDVYGIDPEFIRYFKDEMADFPVLLVAGTMSGTVSVIKVEVKSELEESDKSHTVIEHSDPMAPSNRTGPISISESSDSSDTSNSSDLSDSSNSTTSSDSGNASDSGEAHDV